MNHPVPFHQLEAFLVVARTQSFSAAARELGMSRSAVSQKVRQLEEEIAGALLVRTTRSVSLTELGRRLVETVGPAVAQTQTALAALTAEPGAVTGRLRLTVPRAAFPFVVEPLLPVFRARHPHIEVELVFEDRMVDIVGEGFDAGVRLGEYLERDMVALRLTDTIRFLVVGAPAYFEAHGIPKKPEDLLDHECFTFRSATHGALYAWELGRGKRTWRVPVRGGVVTNDGLTGIPLAKRGLGLAYVMEPHVARDLEDGTLRAVLEPYAVSEDGFFLYYPSRAQRSEPLGLFVETAKELAAERRRAQAKRAKRG